MQGRLTTRLREQGWSQELLRWIYSFFTDREATIYLDKVTSDKFPIVWGLPQGSQISPILFLLYVGPFLRLSKSRFDYANDGCLFASGSTIKTCHANLQDMLDRTLDWGKKSGFPFENAKRICSTSTENTNQLNYLY